MYNVIIYGTESLYNCYLNILKYMEKQCEINIVGVILKDTVFDGKRLDGYKLFREEKITDLQFDYCIVANKDFEREKKEIAEYHIPEQKLLPIKVLSIPNFSFEKYIELKNSNLTILSSNCFAGICYNYLGFEFLSPTINMFFNRSEFNRFISKFDYYINKPLEFVGMKYDEGLHREHPVGKIGDINLYLNHYATFEDAESSWERRKKRINKNNIVVISFSEDKKIISDFLDLPYEKKYIFVPAYMDIHDERNIVKVQWNAAEDGNLGVFINGYARGEKRDINLLDFLLYKESFYRVT